jgi:hypothetical protein
VIIKVITSKISVGEVVEKEFDPAYEVNVSHYSYVAETISNDGLEREQHYNQWLVKIKGKKFGREVIARYSVPEEYFDKIEIGSMFDAKAVTNSRLI